jgi:hypothetical protein
MRISAKSQAKNIFFSRKGAKGAKAENKDTTLSF